MFLILFAFGLGYFLGKSGSAQNSNQGISAEPSQSELIDKRYFNIIGTVTHISGRTLTLSGQNETMDILIEEGAMVRTVLLEQGEISNESPQEVEFESIKIGDSVSVFTEEKQDELSGINVFIYPASSVE